MQNVDLYEVLGVPRDASDSDIKKAFRNKAMTSHPDRGGDPERFRLISYAYEILSDKNNRYRFDKTGSAENAVEADFADALRKGRSGDAKATGASSQEIAIAERLMRPVGEQTHQAGFEEWLRARSTQSSYITDDYIRDTVGVSRNTYRKTVHKCKHATIRIVRKQKVNRATAAEGLHALMETCRETLRPELEWGEVLVNIKYAPVNPLDLTVIKAGEDPLAMWDDDSSTKPVLFAADPEGSRAPEARGQGRLNLGTECVGVVENVGPGVKELREGDWVIPLANNLGTWRTCAVWRERDILKVPNHRLPLEHAAVAKELYLAYHLVQTYAGDLLPGDGVILNAANSLVGQTIIQLCKVIGIRTTAIIRKHSEAEFARLSDYLLDLGATRVFAHDAPIRQKLQQEQAALPKVAFDAVAGTNATVKLIHSMQEGGKIVVYGSLSGEAVNVPWHLFVRSNIIMESFYLSKWLTSSKNQKAMIEAVEQMSKLLDKKALAVNISEYAIHEMERAIEHAVTPGNMSKALLKPLSIAEEEIFIRTMEEEKEKQAKAAKSLQETVFTSHKPASLDENAHPNQKIGIVSNARDGNIVELPSEDSATATVVWLHGFGESPYEYQALFRRTFARDGHCKHVRMVLPEAGNVVQKGDEELLSWFHEDSLESHLAGKGRVGADEVLGYDDMKRLADIEASCESVASAMCREVCEKNCKTNRLVIAGFSQGALVALFTGLIKIDVPIAAIILFGMPPPAKKYIRFITEKCPPNLKKTKIFMLNGSHDPLATPASADRIRKDLSDAGLIVTYETMPNGKHEIGDEEAGHLVAVLNLVVP